MNDIEAELKKMQQLGSVIFPMKGNELFENTKLHLKQRIKAYKAELQRIKHE